MSPTRTRLWRCIGLLVAVALMAGAPAGQASAKKLTKKQRAKVVRQLRAEVKRHPKRITSRKFLKRASLVNFKLPVTLVLRTGDIPATTADESATRNPNSATLDLGASLGQREVDLGGRLAAEIEFADSYSGGALGNVKIRLLPSTTATLQTTSIPLVWNDRVWTDHSTRWDADAVNLLLAGGHEVTTPGCGDFDSSTSDLSKAIAGNLLFGRDYAPVAGGPGLPGFPLHKAADGSDPSPGAQNYDPDHLNVPEGFLPQQSGIDTPSLLQATRNPGDPMALGGNPTPFPFGASPGGFAQPPAVADTVLRTAPLRLQIAPTGTAVNNTGDPARGGDPNGVVGAQNLVVGASGGEANLFGRIPGKAYGIDVTASFATKVSSILRIVDQDLTGRNLIEGEPWPAGVFGCRQVYTGYVNNVIPGVRLTGNLRIAPAITSDGHLRIAKATVATTGEPARFAVAACVAPMASFQEPNLGPGENRPSSEVAPGSYTEYDDNLPSPFSGAVLAPLDPTLYPLWNGQLASLQELPVDVNQGRAAVPDRACNTAPDRLVRLSAMPPFQVATQAPVVPGNGYTETNNGSTITVGADLDVRQVSLDVLVGDVPAPPPPTSGPAASLPVLLPPIPFPNIPVPTIPLPPLPPPPPVVLPSVPLPSSPLPTTTVPPVVLPSVPLPSSPLPTTTVPPVVLPSVPLPSSPLPTTTTPPDVLPSTPLPSSPLPSTTVPPVVLPSTPLPSSPLPSTTVPPVVLPSTPLPSTPVPPVVVPPLGLRAPRALTFPTVQWIGPPFP